MPQDGFFSCFISTMYFGKLLNVYQFIKCEIVYNQLDPFLVICCRYGFDVAGNSRRGLTRNENNTTPYGSGRFNGKGYDWEGKSHLSLREI
jgi:hypothetical protein